MSRTTVPVLSELEPEDVAILHHMAHHCGVSRVQVIRWAIRFYALRGPWTEDIEDRVEAVGTNRRLVTGPGLGEVPV